MTLLTFAANLHFTGPNPVGFHLVNIALHLANGALVYMVIGRTVPHARNIPVIAAVGAAMFLLHPAQGHLYPGQGTAEYIQNRDDSMKMVYVEYEMPGPNRMPFSAAPDRNGALWIPDFGRSNRIGLLDPDTGKVQEFLAPHQGTAGIHSAVPAPDGSVWMAEQASNKVAKWDPKTGKISEYQDTYAAGLEGLEDGGSKHTVRVDPMGRVWGSAVNAPLTMFDPKTNEFSHFRDVNSPYGLTIDKEGTVWFAEFKAGGAIGTVDAKTNRVTKFYPPTPNGWPRRIEMDSNGVIWFAEYRAGKIGRFDPKTQSFKEFQLPGPSPTPYALGIDDRDYV